MYERLLDADRGTYAALEVALKKVFTPRTEESRRLAHSQLASRRLKKREDLDIFVRDLERLLDKAYPEIQDSLRSQQLLDYFLGGIPEGVSHTLLVNPPSDFATTIARARELMLLEAWRAKQRGSVVSAVATDQTMTALVKSLDTITATLGCLESRLDGRRVDCDVSRRDNARYIRRPQTTQQQTSSLEVGVLSVER